MNSTRNIKDKENKKMGTRKSNTDVLTEEQKRSITDRVKRIVVDRSYEIALVGVASIDRFEGAPKGHHPLDFVPDAKAVVVIGLPILDGNAEHSTHFKDSEIVLDEDKWTTPEGEEITYHPRNALRKQIYIRSGHEALNMEIQILGLYAAAFLEKNGYKTLLMPTTYGTTFSWQRNVDPKFPPNVNGFGPFSHRHAAVAAGLGEFGLNNLLLTPQFGPRNRFVTLITRAPLLADPLLEQKVCLGEKCSLCVKGCGGHAFGEIFSFEVAGRKNTITKFDYSACHRGSANCYTKCIAACPIGAF
jgi:epoxyqueuosine reductase QueG